MKDKKRKETNMLVGAIIFLLVALIICLIAGWSLSDKQGDLCIFLLILACFLALVSAFLFVYSKVGEVPGTWYLNEDVIYKVHGQVALPEGKMALVLESENEVICVQTSEPPPAGIHYLVKKNEKTRSKTILSSPDSSPDKEEDQSNKQ